MHATSIDRWRHLVLEIVIPNKYSMVRVAFVYLSILTVFLATVPVECGKEDAANKKAKEGEEWKKKDVRDYSDADIERLYDQWEEADEDELEEDELPEWKKPKPKVDLSKMDQNDPEGMLKMTKKGQTLMMFATVSGNPNQKETEEISKLWHTSLFNANYEVQRYVVGSDRVLFMLKDGALAWNIKDFLVTQDRCASVTIEGKDYHGKGYQKTKDSEQNKANQNTNRAKTKKNKEEL